MAPSYIVYGTFALAGLAIYFLLPRTDRPTRTAGAIFGLAAFAGAMVLCGQEYLAPHGKIGRAHV